MKVHWRQDRLIIGLALFFILLIVGFVMVRRNDFFGAPKEDPLPISVILSESGGPANEALKQGMLQAAQDHNCELVFSAPNTPGDDAGERAMLRREINGVTRGVILDPAGPLTWADVLEINKKVPILSLNENPDKANPKGLPDCVSVDKTAVSRALLSRIQEDHPAAPVHVLYHESLYPPLKIMLSKLSAEAARLSPRLKLRFWPLKDKEAPGSSFFEALRADKTAIVLTLDAAALDQLCLSLDRQGAADLSPDVYAWRFDGHSITWLERDRVRLIVVENGFNQGYLAVTQLAGQLRGKTPAAPKTVNFVLIDRDNMENISNQYLLFPIQ